jgi:hypothetical protein
MNTLLIIASTAAGIYWIGTHFEGWLSVVLGLGYVILMEAFARQIARELAERDATAS